MCQKRWCVLDIYSQFGMGCFLIRWLGTVGDHVPDTAIFGDPYQETPNSLKFRDSCITKYRGRHRGLPSFLKATLIVT